jgi:hypothetical protein
MLVFFGQSGKTGVIYAVWKSGKPFEDKRKSIRTVDNQGA